MKKQKLAELFTQVKEGKISVEEAVLQVKKQPFEDIGYAKIDSQRELRQGNTEVIYGEGKTAEQMLGIIDVMRKTGEENILITRLYESAAEVIQNRYDLHYEKEARIGYIGELPIPDGKGRILVVTGGTSDIPVAEEAAWTAEAMGNQVQRIYDVGVAGIHRTLAHLDEIMSANVIISVAGMEGALASVVAGLADCPVIAVPTSIGYGASFKGLAALLSMLNSCANGVATVNIDNGFGAGCIASMINHR